MTTQNHHYFASALFAGWAVAYNREDAIRKCKSAHGVAPDSVWSVPGDLTTNYRIVAGVPVVDDVKQVSNKIEAFKLI